MTRNRDASILLLTGAATVDREKEGPYRSG